MLYGLCYSSCSIKFHLFDFIIFYEKSPQKGVYKLVGPPQIAQLAELPF